MEWVHDRAAKSGEGRGDSTKTKIELSPIPIGEKIKKPRSKHIHDGQRNGKSAFGHGSDSPLPFLLRDLQSHHVKSGREFQSEKMEALLVIAFLFVVGLIAAFLSSPHHRGAVGERRLRRRLTRFEKEGAKLLSNIYIPKTNGGTSEVDLLLIHPKGLFVFESKNYSGWIFGNETHQYWTQTLPKGRRGGSHKERFYNPIQQNASHIKHLMLHVRKSLPVWSLIVFSDGCELKNVTVRSDNVYVLHCHHAASVVKQICKETPSDYLTEEEIADLYDKLLAYTNVSKEEKRHHAQMAFEAKRRY